MKRIWQSMLVVALVAAWAMPGFAKEEPAAEANKPVAVVSLAGYERIMSDIDFIGGLADNPDLGKNLEGMIKLFTQGQGLAGLKPSEPWGLTLTTDGLSFQPLVFLPVTDLKALLDAVAPLIGTAQETGDGAFELTAMNQKVFLKHAGEWAFIGQSPEALANVPKDPTTLLAGLNKSYEVAVRLYVQNIPELYRSLAIDQLRQGVESGLDRLPDESDEAFATRKKIVEAQLDALTQLINDTEQLTLGWSLDTTAKKTHFDVNMSAVAGSATANKMETARDVTSAFTGFLLPDTGASLNFASKLDKSDIAQALGTLAALRGRAISHVDEADKLKDENSKKIAKEMIGEVFDAIQSTIESGKLDAGALVNVNEKSMAVVVGGYVASPGDLEKALKNFATLAKDEPHFPGIKFDAAKHGNVRFHTATIPVPEEERISKVLGNKLEVAIGIGEKSAYLALGTDSLNLCKKLIDRSKTPSAAKGAPLQVNVALKPIFQFAAAMQEDRPEVAAMAEELAKSEGKDHIQLVVLPQPNAFTLRLSAEEAVMKLLARAGRLAGGGGLPGAP